MVDMVSVILGAFCLVLIAIIIYTGLDLWYPSRQITNVIAALLLIALGCCFILMAIAIWYQVVILTLTYAGKDVIGIYTEDLTKVLGAIGLGTAGMSVITGGFSLIVSGKYELRITSTQPIKGFKIE